MIVKQGIPSRSRFLSAAFALIGLCAAFAWGGAARAQDAPTEVLAATVRTHGFPCDKPLGAERASVEVANQVVWILRCASGVYRVSFNSNRTAQVERVQ